MNMKTHKPGCMINTSCLVVHPDGVCPGPYGKCTCDSISEAPINEAVMPSPTNNQSTLPYFIQNEIVRYNRVDELKMPNGLYDDAYTTRLVKKINEIISVINQL